MEPGFRVVVFLTTQSEFRRSGLRRSAYKQEPCEQPVQAVPRHRAPERFDEVARLWAMGFRRIRDADWLPEKISRGACLLGVWALGLLGCRP